MEEKEIKFTLKGDKQTAWPYKVKEIHPQTGKEVLVKKFLRGDTEYSMLQIPLSWKELQEQLGGDIIKHNYLPPAKEEKPKVK